MNGSESAHRPKVLLWAGFFAIFAAGVGFSVRAGILGDWGRAYGFTRSELGGITGGGLAGFGVIILLGSLLADWIGYGRLMAFAFVMHIISAGLQLAADPIYKQFGREGVYWSLYIAMFLFAIANGVCEAVVNPMVATLFPKDKTHYLNILHAGWPGGLIAGGLLSYVMNGGSIGSWVPLGKVHWLIQMSMFLIPTFVYGILCMGQKFPKSEAAESGLSVGTMLAQFASPILLLLLVIHALVGYVELGTDSWIGRITGTIMGDPTRGLLLFVYTSGLMFILRFFGGPIEHALSPLGLLCLSGVFGAIGLTLLSQADTIVMCVLAASVYALGKTYLWPTMLAVVSERFPKGGAITIGAMGGIGMLSAGFLGGPGIGFKQDYNASKNLQETAPKTFERYVSDHESSFLIFKEKGLDGSKLAAMEIATQASADEISRKLLDKELNDTLAQSKLEGWWKDAQGKVEEDKKPVDEAVLYGGRMALKLTAAVPAVMAVLYLLLIIYFRMTGGYKRVEINPSSAPNENEAFTASGGHSHRTPAGV
ncbi:MAG: MFS transporter [Gemmataceae bacterium]